MDDQGQKTNWRELGMSSCRPTQPVFTARFHWATLPRSLRGTAILNNDVFIGLKDVHV